MPEPRLVSMPNEVIQSIYIHCPTPSLPAASPILAFALSAERYYKAAFMYAFWSNTPLHFEEQPEQTACYEPGRFVRDLFHPSPVPTTDVETKRELQARVFGYRWCTFQNAKRWLDDIMQAVMKDLLSSLDLPLLSADQKRLDEYIAGVPVSHPRMCKADSPDHISSSRILLQYPRCLATSIFIIYHAFSCRSEPRFGSTGNTHLNVVPTIFLEIPERLLTGVWTAEKLDLFTLLTSNVDPGIVKYSAAALNEGMRNALVQENYDAMLSLLSVAVRLADGRSPDEAGDEPRDDCPFEPPQEFFRLIAKKGIRDASDLKSKINQPSPSVGLFTLLLRAHAESMPRNDPDIELWAKQLRIGDNVHPVDQQFASWILDWSSVEEWKELVTMTESFGRYGQWVVRRPLFNEGGISFYWRAREAEMADTFMELWKVDTAEESMDLWKTKMAEKFMDLWKSRDGRRWVPSFESEVGERMEARTAMEMTKTEG